MTNTPNFTSTDNIFSFKNANALRPNSQFEFAGTIYFVKGFTGRKIVAFAPFDGGKVRKFEAIAWELQLQYGFVKNIK